MTQIAEPQVHLSTLRSRRAPMLVALGALLAAAIIVTLVITIGSGTSATSIPRAGASAPSVDAGPTPGTPSAVARALGSERVRGGFSLTTNVPAPPRFEAGPSIGTPAAVSEALHPSEPRYALPDSLTTNVPAPPRADAGPATGTPTAVRDALSAR